MKNIIYCSFISFVLIFGCIEKKNQNNQCNLIEILVFKELKNNKIEFKNDNIHFQFSFKDTLDSIKKLNLNINDILIKNAYIYKKNLLEKEFQDKETLILSNLESSFKFGKDKLIYTGRPIYSIYGVKSNNRNSVLNSPRFSGNELNFFESGRFVDTYYLTFNITKASKKYNSCTIRFRLVENNIYLEKAVMRSSSHQQQLPR